VCVILAIMDVNNFMVMKKRRQIIENKTEAIVVFIDLFIDLLGLRPQNVKEI